MKARLLGLGSYVKFVCANFRDRADPQSSNGDTLGRKRRVA